MCVLRDRAGVAEHSLEEVAWIASATVITHARLHSWSMDRRAGRKLSTEPL